MEHLLNVTVTGQDFSQCPDLRSIAQEGSYPYNICYMVFILRQIRNTKQLIRTDANFLDIKE